MADDLGLRQLLVSLGMKLSPEEAEALCIIYLRDEDTGSIKSGNDAVKRILNRERIHNCKDSLDQLKRSLESVGQGDLTGSVDKYLVENPKLPDQVPKVSTQLPKVSTTNEQPENDGDLSKSVFSIGVVG